MILSDMVFEANNTVDLAFSKHLYCTKIWFSRISWSNKKRYLLALLDDVRSAYTLSLLLKAMWNCRPKDAVLSYNDRPPWTVFDQVPMDHNRTAQPITLLTEVMKNDRKWFLNLNYESQAMVLTELLSVSGGPILWVVMKRAQKIYETYRNQQLQDIMECLVVSDKNAQATKDEAKKEPPPKPNPNDPHKVTARYMQAQKALDSNLASWNSEIKSLQNSMKLEEVEMKFKDGSTKKIWKVNRPKPEATETVDFMQSLPASIGKRILSYLPKEKYGDYAKVNKYWAYLVEDLKAENNTRMKLDLELQKINEIISRYDISLNQTIQKEYNVGHTVYSAPASTAAQSLRIGRHPPSLWQSEKSTHYSFPHFLGEHLQKQRKPVQLPIKNLREVRERLDRRGAADENLFRWCKNLVKIVPDTALNEDEGILNMGNLHFPCPLMKQSMMVPLQKPLEKDPAVVYSPKEPPNFTLPCDHYTVAYRCTSLRHVDITAFHSAFYKKPDKVYQDNFILKHTKVNTTKRHRPVNNRGNKKEMAVTYFARRRHTLIPVCKRTFLSILALKKGRVTGVISRHFKSVGESAQENRGGSHKAQKYEPKIKAVKEFIKKLIPLEIHYCRSKIKSRQYLASELSINKLYRMFIAETAFEHKNIKSSYFRKIFNTEFNIGFGSPRTDMCSTCIVLQERLKHEKDTEIKTKLMIESRIHKMRAKAFYGLLKDNTENLLILSFDCQKNQPCPKVPDQSAYYSRQLYVYNFTVVVGNSKSPLTVNNTFIYTWTEDVLPKASNEIASAVYHCLNNIFMGHGLEHITQVRLVADGCSGQNKNQSVLGMAAKWLQDNAPEQIKGVDIVFPIVGHSFLPPDRVFAKIEKEIKSREVLSSPYDYYEFFLNHGTVYYLGLDVKVYNWKQSSAEVLKTTNNMHFSIKKSKRFFLKRTRNNQNVYIRAEETYQNTLNKYQNICKGKKTVSAINPDVTKLYVDVKQQKLNDVKKLLITHYGEKWEEITDLHYYKQVLLRPKSSTAHEDVLEECDYTEELPLTVV